MRLVPLLVQMDRLLRAAGVTGRQLHTRNGSTESPDINYPINYIGGIREVRRAMIACRQLLSRVTAPALVIQSEGDPVVEPDSARIILRNLGSQHKRLVSVPSDRHIIVRGDEHVLIADAVNEFLLTPAPAGGAEGAEGGAALPGA